MNIFENIENDNYDMVNIREKTVTNHDRFMKDLAEANEIDPTHPKLEKLYWHCWSAGHSAGLHEVAIVFADWCDLIK